MPQSNPKIQLCLNCHFSEEVGGLVLYFFKALSPFTFSFQGNCCAYLCPGEKSTYYGGQLLSRSWLWRGCSWPKHSSWDKFPFPLISILWIGVDPLLGAIVTKEGWGSRVTAVSLLSSATSVGRSVSRVRSEWNSNSAGSGPHGFQRSHLQMWWELKSLYAATAGAVLLYRSTTLSHGVGLTPKCYDLSFQIYWAFCSPGQIIPKKSWIKADSSVCCLRHRKNIHSVLCI